MRIFPRKTRCRSVCILQYVAPVALALWITLLLPYAFASTFTSRKINVLILTGQNNHDWKATTPVLKRILESSGRFTVTVTEHPERCSAQSLKPYDVILSNWNTYGGGPVLKWPKAARDGIINFVRDGKGFVVVHAGGSSFYDWPEYQKMVAATWGNGVTWHAPKHLFYVHITDPSHPITHGLRIFVTDDELWNNTMVQPNVRALASAYSDKASGGSGNDEPILFVRKFGKGRTCALMLGHDASAMSDLGFQTLLRRGAQWAATGKVTIPVPNMSLTSAQLDFVLKGVAAYHSGDQRDPLWMLQYDVGQVAGTSQAAPTAQRLIQLITDPKATLEGRQFACRQLALIGNSPQAPVLASLFSDSSLGFEARYALECIPGVGALKAMRSALVSSSGNERLGLISALAARKDIRSLPVYRKLALGSDPGTVSASIIAIGDVGNPTALKTLQEIGGKLPSSMRLTYLHALMRCAIGLQDRGELDLAYQTFKVLAASGMPVSVRSAASYDMITSSGGNKMSLLLDDLKSDNSIPRSAAIRQINLHSNALVIQKAFKQFNRIRWDSQSAILLDSAIHGMRMALPYAFHATTSVHLSLRNAAIDALGKLGDSKAVTPIIRAGKRDASSMTAVTEALEELRGKYVNKEIVSALSASKPQMQHTLLNVLVERGAHEVTPALLRLATRPGLRMEIVRAIGQLGSVKDCPALLQMLQSASDAQRNGIAEALVSICSRSHTVAPLLSAYNQSAGAVKVSLIWAIGSVGGPNALPPLAQAALFPDPLISIPAINSLSSWNDVSALAPLCKAYQTAYTDDVRTLALRGIVQVVQLASKEEYVATANQLANTLKAANTPADQNTFLSLIGKLPCKEALRAVRAYFSSQPTAETAELAAINIARSMIAADPREISQTIRPLLSSPNADIRSQAKEIWAQLALGTNLAPGGVATHPDGLERDGQASGAQAAIDGDPKTYWDETDNQKLYVLQVHWRKPIVFNTIRIMGYMQENYAPKDFDVVCDGKVIKQVTNAAYTNNLLTVPIPVTQCSTLQLRITGYYGNSPAIRELELYNVKEGE